MYDCVKDDVYCDKKLEDMINENVTKGNYDATICFLHGVCPTWTIVKDRRKLT